MNAAKRAALRKFAEVEMYATVGPSVLALLDEIAELRRGLERVRDRDHSSIDEDMAAVDLGFDLNTCGWCDSVEIVVSTLARADAIGGGE